MWARAGLGESSASDTGGVTAHEAPPSLPSPASHFPLVFSRVEREGWSLRKERGREGGKEGKRGRDGKESH